jgi:hypothetical protein
MISISPYLTNFVEYDISRFLKGYFSKNNDFFEKYYFLKKIFVFFDEEYEIKDFEIIKTKTRKYFQKNVLWNILLLMLIMKLIIKNVMINFMVFVLKWIDS